MANEKITDLDAHGAFDDTDLVEVVDDPSGTPDNEKAEVGDLLDYAASRNVRETTYGSLASPTSAGLLTFISDGVAVARDDGAAQAHYGPIHRLAPLDQSGWSWTNQGSATVTQGGGVVLIESPTAAGVSLRIRRTTAPSAPYIITAAVIPWFPNVDGQLVGVGVRENTSGELILVQARKTSGRIHIDVRKYNSATSESTQAAVTPDFVDIVTPVFLQFEDNNTNLIWRYSLDGVNFVQLFSEARTTFLTPDQIAFAMNVNGGQTARASIISWRQT